MTAMNDLQVLGACGTRRCFTARAAGCLHMDKACSKRDRCADFTQQWQALPGDNDGVLPSSLLTLFAALETRTSSLEVAPPTLNSTNNQLTSSLLVICSLQFRFAFKPQLATPTVAELL